MTEEREWYRVTRSNPCKICERPDWCGFTDTVIRCMRVPSDKPMSMENGGGWIHQKDSNAIREWTPPPKKEKPKVDWREYVRKAYLHPNAAEMRKGIAEEFAVDLRTIESLRVGWGWDDYRNKDFSVWPMKNGSQKYCGAIRRYQDGDKKAVKGSSQCLFYQEWFWFRYGPIFLVEGASDTSVIADMGLPVIGRPSNVGGVRALIPLIRDNIPSNRTIVVLGEYDENPEKRGHKPDCEPGCKKHCNVDCPGCQLCWPGIFGMLSTQKALQAKLPHRIMVTAFFGAKDVRDFTTQSELHDAELFLAWVRSSLTGGMINRRIDEIRNYQPRSIAQAIVNEEAECEETGSDEAGQSSTPTLF